MIEERYFASLPRSQESHYNREGDLKLIPRVSSAHGGAGAFVKAVIRDDDRFGQAASQFYPAQTEGLDWVLRGTSG
jgi:hypothetical protein